MDNSIACGSCLVRNTCQTVCNESQVPTKTRWKAITIAYIVPFVLLIAAVILVEWLGYSEELAGGAAIVVVGVYYGLLWLVRKSIDKRLKID